MPTPPEAMTEIRTATLDDAPAVATIHSESWRDAYRGILPDDYLDREAARERRRYWTKALARPGRRGFVLIAVRGEETLGFVSVSRPGETGYDADIENLHVEPGLRGEGLGRKLLGAAAERLMAAGAISACLRVYDANKGAARFYRRMGGVADARGLDPFAGADMPDTRYGWRDLAVLAAACGVTPAPPSP